MSITGTFRPFFPLTLRPYLSLKFNSISRSNKIITGKKQSVYTGENSPESEKEREENQRKKRYI